MKSEVPAVRRFEEMVVGMTVSFTHTITEADLDAFASLSGDLNPLHTSENEAGKRGYSGRVVHGAYLIALLSRMVGMHLPGNAALLHSVNVRFALPVYMGERVTVTATVEQLSEAVRTIVMGVAVMTEDGRKALSGRIQAGFRESSQ